MILVILVILVIADLIYLVVQHKPPFSLVVVIPIPLPLITIILSVVRGRITDSPLLNQFR